MFKYGIKKSNNLSEVATFVKKCSNSSDNREAEEANEILRVINYIKSQQKKGINFNFKNSKTYTFGYDYFEGVTINDEPYEIVLNRALNKGSKNK